MNEVDMQLVEVMAQKVIAAIDGYPTDGEGKSKIAAAIARRIVEVVYE